MSEFIKTISDQTTHHAEDCYYFVDSETDKEEDAFIDILCVECRDKHYPNIGWFWEGSKLGYGSLKCVCCRCNKLISDPGDYDEIKNTL